MERSWNQIPCACSARAISSGLKPAIGTAEQHGFDLGLVPTHHFEQKLEQEIGASLAEIPLITASGGPVSKLCGFSSSFMATQDTPYRFGRASRLSGPARKRQFISLIAQSRQIGWSSGRGVGHPELADEQGRHGRGQPGHDAL